MAAVVSLSLLTVLATAALALFEPLLHPKHLSVRIYWVAPLAGALILLFTGQISVSRAVDGLLADSAVNPIKILILFFSMTLMSVFLDEAGFFRFLAGKVLRHAGNSQKKLFLMLYLAVSVLTVFTSNDIVVLTFTPFICYFAKNAKIDPIPYLIAEFVAANTWSMALIIGNPTNIYLAAGNGIDFAAYLKVMVLPTVFGGLVSLGILWLLFVRKLKEPMAGSTEEVHIADPVTVTLGLASLGGCIVFLALSSYLNFPMWVIAAVACLLLYAAAIPELLWRHRGLSLVTHSIRRAPFDVIPFVLSMFVLVMALSDVGATDLLGKLVLGRGEIFACGISSFFAANLLNNIPMSVLYSTVVTAGGSASLPALYAAVVGSNVGAFFTPMGALAGIMWMTLLKQHKVKFSFGRFVLYGAAVSIPTLLATLLGLWIML
ncbi:MAG: hypothetical protein IJX39_06365 [Clostridia bacterium]|nr:hypothetical protein [Clostridia bacterium]MBQ8357418.1 hypothetical protein [Clostridia bacterium]